MAKLTARARGFAAFVWDFVVGDDWRLALVVIVGLAVTALVASSGVVAWWLLPALCGTVLALSVWRASDPRN